MRIRIALDGPAASGKGTVARGLATELGYDYIDTGTLYRTVGWVARQKNIDLKDVFELTLLARQLNIALNWDGKFLHVLLDGEDITSQIRTEQAGQDASKVAKLGPVRVALLDLQRRMAENGGVVMDGRDIGSVVMPEAELKVYLDASLDERAIRRFREQQSRGFNPVFEEIKEEIRLRDFQDSSRESAPLKILPDALHLDTTGMTPQEVIDVLLKEAKFRGA